MALSAHWPFFALRIKTPRLVLRPPTDADLEELVEVARRGVHDPAMMPFVIPWTDVPSPRFEREALQYWWRCRSELTPRRWDLVFAVEYRGELVGAQNLGAVEFPLLRTAETGSWLGLEHQSRGIGKEMRAAIVAFAFECLDATVITSRAFVDNMSSQKVSLATGYEPNGVDVVARRGEPAEQICFRLSRERWLDTRPSTSVDVTGFEACRSALGLES
ncbi:MAG: GNAT family N-acetyltransferase [Acidimicrobiales bacterium]